MAAHQNMAEQVSEVVNNLMRKAVAEATEAAMAAALIDFDSRLRRALADTAIDTAVWFDVAAHGEQIVITVKLPNDAKKA